MCNPFSPVNASCVSFICRASFTESKRIEKIGYFPLPSLSNILKFPSIVNTWKNEQEKHSQRTESQKSMDRAVRSRLEGPNQGTVPHARQRSLAMPAWKDFIIAVTAACVKFFPFSHGTFLLCLSCHYVSIRSEGVVGGAVGVRNGRKKITPS